MNRLANCCLALILSVVCLAAWYFMVSLGNALIERGGIGELFLLMASFPGFMSLTFAYGAARVAVSGDA